jgi:hypothetical protein
MNNRIPIARRSMLQRLERRLADRGQRLMKHRHRSNEEVAGTYFILDEGNVVVEPRLTPDDLEKLARKLKAVATYEEVER